MIFVLCITAIYFHRAKRQEGDWSDAKGNLLAKVKTANTQQGNKKARDKPFGK